MTYSQFVIEVIVACGRPTERTGGRRGRERRLQPDERKRNRRKWPDRAADFSWEGLWLWLRPTECIYWRPGLAAARWVWSVRSRPSRPGLCFFGGAEKLSRQMENSDSFARSAGRRLRRRRPLFASFARTQTSLALARDISTSTCVRLFNLDRRILKPRIYPKKQMRMNSFLSRPSS